MWKHVLVGPTRIFLSPHLILDWRGPSPKHDKGRGWNYSIMILLGPIQVALFPLSCFFFSSMMCKAKRTKQRIPQGIVKLESDGFGVFHSGLIYQPNLVRYQDTHIRYPNIPSNERSGSPNKRRGLCVIMYLTCPMSPFNTSISLNYKN